MLKVLQEGALEIAKDERAAAKIFSRQTVENFFDRNPKSVEFVENDYGRKRGLRYSRPVHAKGCYGLLCS